MNVADATGCATSPNAVLPMESRISQRKSDYGIGRNQ